MNVVIYLQKEEKNVKWEELSQIEKRNISSKLNQHGLNLLGYVPQKERT